MRCPRCGFPDDKVVDSRATREGMEIRRRRECLQCGHRFTTHEEIIQAELKVIKRDQTREDLDTEKIRRGVEKACWKRNIGQDDIDELIRKVVSEIECTYDREVSSAEIGNIIMRHLRELDKVAYIRFASIYRDFQDVDEFLEEIRSFDRKQKKK